MGVGGGSRAEEGPVLRRVQGFERSRLGVDPDQRWEKTHDTRRVLDWIEGSDDPVAQPLVEREGEGEVCEKGQGVGLEQNKRCSAMQFVNFVNPAKYAGYTTEERRGAGV